MSERALRDGPGSGQDLERPQTYTAVAVALHWTIAALILCNLAIGLLMDRIGLPDRLGVVETHVAIGLSVLLLSVFRLVWRLAHRPPTRSVRHRRWERKLSGAVHAAFYAAMLLMPLSGWALVSANPPPGSAGEHVRADLQPPAVRDILRRHGPLTIAHAVDLPLFGPLAEIGATPAGLRPQGRIHDRLVSGHEIGGFVLIALVALHVAGALKHEWFDREAELARMTIRRRPRADRPVSASESLCPPGAQVPDLHSGKGEIPSSSHDRPRA